MYQSLSFQTLVFHLDLCFILKQTRNVSWNDWKCSEAVLLTDSILLALVNLYMKSLTFALFYLMDSWPTLIFFLFKSHTDSVTEPPLFLFRNTAKVKPYVTLNDAKRSWLMLQFSFTWTVAHCSPAYTKRAETNHSSYRMQDWAWAQAHFWLFNTEYFFFYLLYTMWQTLCGLLTIT